MHSFLKYIINNNSVIISRRVPHLLLGLTLDVLAHLVHHEAHEKDSWHENWAENDKEPKNTRVKHG